MSKPPDYSQAPPRLLTAFIRLGADGRIWWRNFRRPGMDFCSDVGGGNAWQTTPAGLVKIADVMPGYVCMWLARNRLEYCPRRRAWLFYGKPIEAAGGDDGVFRYAAALDALSDPLLAPDEAAGAAGDVPAGVVAAGI